MRISKRLFVAVAATTLCTVQPLAASCSFSQSWGNTLRGGGPGDTFTRGSDKVKVKDKKDGKLTLVNPYGEEKEFTEAEYSKLIFDCQTLGQFPAWGKQTSGGSLTAERMNQGLDVPIVTASQGLDVADLNGDGFDDIVQINARHTVVTVVLGSAEGYGRDRTEIPTGSSNETLALADLDGDGAPDLVVARQGEFTPEDTGSLAVFMGSRDGSFGPQIDYPAGIAPQSVALADFDGDGRMDAAVANGGSFGAPSLPPDNGSLSILLGDGAGGFGAPATQPVGNGPRSVLAFEANGDGNLDLAVANRDDGSVAVLLGSGDGGVGAPRAFAVGARPTFLGSADFNGDGHSDIAVLHRMTATISMWLGDGAGSYRANGRYLCGSNIRSFDIMQPGADARPTIISPDGSGNSYLLLVADTDGTLVAPAAYPVGPTPGAAAAGDFDGDGEMDLAVGSSEQAAVLFSPKPFDHNQQTPQLLGGAGAHAVAVADFNGDGRDDLASSEGSSAVVREGRADKTWGAPMPLNTGGRVRDLTTLDANGDGRIDLAVLKDSTVALYLGGAGGLGARAELPAAAGAHAVAAADFNNDGLDDLLVAGETQAAVLPATGSGGFGPAVSIASTGRLQAAATGDFNNDDNPDAAVSGIVEASSFRFGVLLIPGDGAGGFGQPIVTESDFGPADLSAQDFNRDGYLDLFVAHCCGETNLTFLQGTGNGEFAATSLPGGASPTSLAAADFDRDGDLDLAVAADGDGRTAGSVSILANNAPPVDHAPATGGLPGTLAPDSIVSAYGAGLAGRITAAESPDWPQTLGGVSLSVRDSQGAERPARIAFASPGQVNYHLPSGLAEGPATATVRTADGRTLSAPIFVRPLSPGLFVADATRLAAAWVIRVKPDGEQILEPVVELAPGGALRGAAIDLSIEGDIVVLQLFGTGIRGAAPGSVTATIDGVPATVLYSGPQNQFPGLDQVNIEIPRSLAGRGVVEVALTIEGSLTETARIRLK